MGELKWHKRDHAAALGGMLPLTLEERGAYNTILDLIYLKDGRLEDDDDFLLVWLRVRPQVWRRLKARLLDLGKIRLEDGLIVNGRAAEEVPKALKRITDARQAGKRSAANREQTSSKPAFEKPVSTEFDTPVSGKINDLASTTVDTPTPRVRKKERTDTLPGILAAEPPPRDMVADAFAAFNAVADRAGLPQAVELTPQRRSKITARLKTHGPDGWQRALDKLAEAPWLRGENPDHWRAGIDFFVRPDKFNGILEGSYDRHGAAQSDMLADVLQRVGDEINGHEGSGEAGQRPHTRPNGADLAAPAQPQDQRAPRGLDKDLHPGDRRDRPDRARG